MNAKLATILIALSQPTKLKEFLSDPSAYLSRTNLSDVDKMAILSRNKGLLKYQARFGDLTMDKLREMNFDSSDWDIEHEHVEIGPEHEEGHEEDIAEGLASNTLMGDPIKRTFGPHTHLFGMHHDVRQIADRCVDKKANFLVVVGTGISAAHITQETRSWIAASDVLLYCVADAATELEIQGLNANHE
jgi:hypothetical protein